MADIHTQYRFHLLVQLRHFVKYVSFDLLIVLQVKHRSKLPRLVDIPLEVGLLYLDKDRGKGGLSREKCGSVS